MGRRPHAILPPDGYYLGSHDVSERIPAHKLDAQGIETSAEVHWNLTTAPLVEDAVRRGEGQLTKLSLIHI